MQLHAVSIHLGNFDELPVKVTKVDPGGSGMTQNGSQVLLPAGPCTVGGW